MSMKTKEYKLLDGRTIRAKYDRLGMCKISRENLEGFVEEFNIAYRQAKTLEKITENYALSKVSEPNKGKWIRVDSNMYTCSKCSHCFTISPEDNHIRQFKYCPNCKTEMINE